MNIVHDLAQKKCVPCEGETKPLNPTEYRDYHEQVKDWEVVEEKKIEKKFKFKNFADALTFVNNVGAIAEAENHHPNIYLYGWNKVTITLTTHAIGGLSVNDFIVAYRINKLLLK